MFESRLSGTIQVTRGQQHKWKRMLAAGIYQASLRNFLASSNNSKLGPSVFFPVSNIF